MSAYAHQNQQDQKWKVCACWPTADNETIAYSIERRRQKARSGKILCELAVFACDCRPQTRHEWFCWVPFMFARSWEVITKYQQIWSRRGTEGHRSFCGTLASHVCHKFARVIANCWYRFLLVWSDPAHLTIIIQIIRYRYYYIVW
jgi:hypothetical protein